MMLAADHRAGRNPSVQFTLSVPPSRTSSPSPSPSDDLEFSSLDGYLSLNEKAPNAQNNHKSLAVNAGPFAAGEDLIPGRLSTNIYDTTLPRWRAAIRRSLVKTVRRESEVIARMQDMIRTPWLDAYFVYTSSLGTHTFFMTVLPAFFFFGYGEMGRGLLVVLALGVYFSSVVKDLICSPRPFAPPVTRLTIGSHHLEYGFPSTHSTNSVSIALFLFGHVHRLASAPSPTISPDTFTILTLILAFYTFSIVYGRLYTAMHSFTDCATGVALGAGIWWAHSSWSGIPFMLSSSNPLFWICSLLGLGTHGDLSTRVIHIGKGLGAGEWMESWVRRGGWEVPLILIPICLLAVNQHPQPVDDCPCFEDAIAFMSVVLGSLVARWAVGYAGVGPGMWGTVIMPGSGWVYESGQWMEVERNMSDIGLWWGIAALKMVLGILVIFVWRLIAKSMLHLILPPTFRLLSRVFRLPNRRFYTPATDYKSVPSEFSVNARGGGFGLHPIPSVIDLPGTGGVGEETGGIGSGVSGVASVGHRDIKMRSSGAGAGEKEKMANGNGNESARSAMIVEKEEAGGKDAVKHYDADVLTKVIVYAGIAVLACEAIPLTFEALGWGIRSWV